MPIKAGQQLLHGATIETRDGGEDVEPGDAVTISAGSMSPAGDGDNFAGVAVNRNAVALSGAVVAAVQTDDPDGAVVEGVTVGPSGTAGELSRGYSTDIDGNAVYDQPGPILALSDAGGTWHGRGGATYDIPDGYAAVFIR